MAARPQPRVTPVLNGDEARYRRRYRTLKDMVNDLSDESNLLALRVHQIQRRMYDAHMLKHGTPPPAISVPDGASWAPLVQNASHYPSDVGAIKRPPRNQTRRQTQSQSESRTPSTSPPVEERRNGLARPARPAKGRSGGLGSRKRARSPEVRRGRSESLNGDEDDEDEDEEEEEEEEREERLRSSHRRARTEEEDEEDDEEGESGSEQNVDAEIEDMMDDDY